MRAWFCSSALIGLALLTPRQAAAAPARLSPYSYCAADGARVDRFDRGLAPDWIISERAMKTAAAPYPDGTIDGDTSANVRTDGGLLHLLSRRAGPGFTGSRILSRQPLRYGCVEFVAKLPRGRGFWPALWMRTPYGSPINGEIDMLEGFGSHPGVFVSTLHHWHAGIDATAAHRRYVAGVDSTYTCAKVVADTPASPVAMKLAIAGARITGTDPRTFGNWLFASYNNACTLVPVAKDTDFAAGFHRYLVVWTPQRVIWALDGRPFFATTDDVPQTAMMIVMGLSVGSLDGGPNAQTPASADLQVRSVRIMQLANKR